MIIKLSDATTNKRYFSGRKKYKKEYRNVLIDKTSPILVNLRMFPRSGKCTATVIFEETWRWFLLKKVLITTWYIKQRIHVFWKSFMVKPNVSSSMTVDDSKTIITKIHIFFKESCLNLTSGACNICQYIQY